jgi:hypothetical protein
MYWVHDMYQCATQPLNGGMQLNPIVCLLLAHVCQRAMRRLECSASVLSCLSSGLSCSCKRRMATKSAGDVAQMQQTAVCELCSARVALGSALRL